MKKLLIGLLAIVMAGTTVAAISVAPSKLKTPSTHVSLSHSRIGEEVTVAAKHGRPLASVARSAGEATTLLSATFDSDLCGFTVVDANGDGKAWKWESGAVVVYNSYDMDADDWLISTGVNLKADSKYTVSVDLKGSSRTYKEKFELKAGTSADVAAMTATLIEPTVIASTTYESYTAEFTPTADGTYYFGLHEISEKDEAGFSLYADNFTVTSEDSGSTVDPIDPDDPEIPTDPETVFEATFDSDLCGFSIIDANGDNTMWMYSMQSACVWTFGSAPSDDWLVTPGIAMSAGRKYTFAIDVNGMSTNSTEKFEVKAGQSPVADAMTEEVIAVTTIQSMSYETFSGEFTPTVDGTYYIGIHCVSDPDQFGLYVDNVKLTAPALEADVPAAPTGVGYVETSNPGEVTISWDAVTADKNGTPLSAEDVSYNVYIVGNDNLTAVGQNIKDCSMTYRAVPEGAQKFVQFAVFAQTEKGEGDGAGTSYGPVGTPYPSYKLTCEPDLDNYILGVDYSGGLTAGIYGDADFEDLASQDNDDFYIAFYGTRVDQYGSVFTGKISLEEMKNPTLVYYTYNLGLDGTADLNEITVEVVDMATGEASVLSTKVVAETGPTDSWNRVQLDLTPYSGKVIMVYFTVTVKTAGFTMLDNISIGSVVDYDLEASKISAPDTVEAGETIGSTVTVRNLGSNAAESYAVSLYADGELFATATGASLAAGETAIHTFEYATMAIDHGSVKFYATVDYAADEVTSNNRTPEVTVEIAKPTLPAVSDLAAETRDKTVVLSWSEPDIDSAPADRITESFEDGDAFSDTFGAWTFVDVDDMPVGGISTIDIPGITPGTTKGAFWIWDMTLVHDPLTGARTGKKFLFSLFRYDDEQADDWAISPELDGSAQTITFYAKSYTSLNRERIEVYYSTGSTSPADFIKIKDAETVAPYWEEYVVSLPAGARHFAIRSFAVAGYRLSIDDVTFTPAGNANLDLIGYNIYRDGEKINEEPVEETEYIDETIELDREYNYVVTTIYTKGESAGSNAVAITCSASGVDGIASGAIEVKTENHVIVINGAAGLSATVHAVDGREMFAGVCGANVAIPVEQGVYVVKVGSEVAKLVVK